MLGHQLGTHLDRQPCLAGAAGPGESDEPGSVAKQGDDLADFALSPNKAGYGLRQVGVRDRLEWWEYRLADLENPHRLFEIPDAVLTQISKR